jgi:uncharacterized protein
VHRLGRYLTYAALLFAALLPLRQAAAGPTFPQLTGRVVDQAGLLSQAARQKLTAELAKEEQSDGNQVVVVTLKSLDGYDIRDYGYQLGRHWGIGQKGKDNGVLLIVAPNERKVSIEVGYGLEGTLTDALSDTIIRNAIVPQFRRGDMQAGILAGVKSILAVVHGDTSVAQSAPRMLPHRDPRLAHFLPFFIIAVLILGGLVSMLSRTLAAVIMWPIAAGIAWLIFGSLLLAILLATFVTVLSVFNRGAGGGMWMGGGPWMGGGFGGGGFGGGGGFSGGGGSFGGGGASGGW